MLPTAEQQQNADSRTVFTSQNLDEILMGMACELGQLLATADVMVIDPDQLLKSFVEVVKTERILHLGPMKPPH